MPLAVVVLLSLLVSMRPSAPAQGPSELEGIWEARSMEGNGSRMPDALVEQVVFTFAGEKLVLRGFGGEVIEQVCTFKIDPAASPKRLDFTPPNGRTIFGIYEIGGEKKNELRVAFMRGGGADTRPAKFASTPGSNILLIALEKRGGF